MAEQLTGKDEIRQAVRERYAEAALAAAASSEAGCCTTAEAECGCGDGNAADDGFLHDRSFERQLLPIAMSLHAHKHLRAATTGRVSPGRAGSSAYP